jgi:hypothetical protein
MNGSNAKPGFLSGYFMFIPFSHYGEGIKKTATTAD